MCVKGGSKMKTKLTERKGAKGLIIALLLAVSMIIGVVTISSATENEGHYWTHGDWSSRVAWEARHALSRSATGSSAWPINSDSHGPRWYGDWNYVADDWYAYGKAFNEAHGKTYPDLVGNVADDSLNHHRGGQCTFFVRLILLRATYWTGYGDHLTTPQYPNGLYAHVDGGYMTDNYASVQSGWVFITADNTHYAIADSRAYVNGQWGWWFIDANYVGGRGNFFIGKHFMPDWKLRADNYRAWRPDRASYN